MATGSVILQVKGVVFFGLFLESEEQFIQIGAAGS